MGARPFPYARGMCGRFQFAPSSPAVVEEEFELEATPDWPARWNLAPSQAVPTIRLGAADGLPREAGAMAWGLVPAWAKEGRAAAGFINARIETAASKPSFREAWSRRRCLVASTGWYEWTRKGGPPTLLRREDGAPFAMAGLWEPAAEDRPDARPTVTILTTAAAPEIEAVHHRMPVVLRREEQEAWLREGVPGIGGDPERPRLAHALAVSLVSKRLNKVREEGPELMTPEPEEGPGLFG
jgi:putative SOS response-associated peptidase YedK